MSYSIFNPNAYLNIPGDLQTSPHKDTSDYYPNEKSFLSDFNPEDELFGGMSTHQNRPSHPVTSQQRNNLPISQQKRESNIPFNKATEQLIAHKNNAVLNKIVGFKRRKIDQTSEQMEQELQFDHYLEQRQIAYQKQYVPQDSMNSSSSVDPVFYPPSKSSQKSSIKTTTVGCTGGPQSYQSSRGMNDHDFHLDAEDYANESNISSSFYDIDEYKKIKKRMQNKDSAVRSRMKKKAYYDTLEVQLNSCSQENNKLKLDNAALRAENTLLKKHLSYFENLFAKKTQMPLSSHKDSTVNTEGNLTPIDVHSMANSRCGGLSDDEIYNGKAQLYPFNIRKRQQPQYVAGAINSEEIYSQYSGDIEATRGMRQQQAQKLAENNSEVSFVLERRSTDSNGSNSPGKLGMFTIALVMCVCCFSSFFAPLGVDGTPSGAIKGQGLVGGKTLFTVDPSLQNEPLSATLTDTTTIVMNDQAAQSFILISWGNFLRFAFLVFFAITILTFPMDDLKQWAARKAWLRKIFNLNEIPIQASKNIKNL